MGSGGGSLDGGTILAAGLEAATVDHAGPEAESFNMAGIGGLVRIDFVKSWLGDRAMRPAGRLRLSWVFGEAGTAAMSLPAMPIRRHSAARHRDPRSESGRAGLSIRLE
jgi:hypothetical protein